MAVAKKHELFGKIAIGKKFITAQQLEECLQEQQRKLSLGISERIGDILCSKEYMDFTQVREVLKIQGVKLREIGGYELIQKVGQGGMGAVYKARQKNLDRIVALKILPPGIEQNKSFIERFFQEARSAAKLNHPNIVRGIDVGQAGEFYYFAMEFVDGKSLRELIKEEGAISEKRALALTEQVALALQHAAKSNIVHRDIKPDNILLDNSGTAKLSDLGLAFQNEDMVKAKTGATLGTPHYISPEQASGEKNVDTRSDIYSLGATLYHMVTGNTPFEAESAAVLMTKHINEEPEDPKSINPLLSKEIGILISKMMTKRREDRYQTPDELLADIRAIMEGKPIKSAAPAPAPAQPRPQRQSHRPKTADARNAQNNKPDPAKKRLHSKQRHEPAKADKKNNKTLYIIIGAAAALILVVIIIVISTRNKDQNTAQQPPTKDTTPPKKNNGKPKDKAPSDPDDKISSEILSSQKDMWDKAETYYEENKNLLGALPIIYQQYKDIFNLSAASSFGKKAAAKMETIATNWCNNATTIIDDIKERSNTAMDERNFRKAERILNEFPWQEGTPIIDFLGKLESMRNIVSNRCERFVKEQIKKAQAMTEKNSVVAIKDAINLIDDTKLLSLPAYSDQLDRIISELDERRKQLVDEKIDDKENKAKAEFQSIEQAVLAQIRSRDYAEARKSVENIPDEIMPVQFYREKIEEYQLDSRMLDQLLSSITKNIDSRDKNRTKFRLVKSSNLPVILASWNAGSKTITYKTTTKSNPITLSIKDISPLGILDLHDAANKTKDRDYYLSRIVFVIYEYMSASDNDNIAKELLSIAADDTIQAQDKGADTTRLLEKLQDSKDFKVKIAEKELQAKRAEQLKNAKPGIAATYYKEGNFEKKVLSKIENKLDFPGGAGFPAEAGKANFSVRWAGAILVEKPGEYTITVKIDDGSQVWVDGKMIIDSWKPQAPTDHSGKIQLEQGLHTIEIKFYQGGGGSHFQLFWESKDIKKQVVPAENLFHTEADLEGN